MKQILVKNIKQIIEIFNTLKKHFDDQSEEERHKKYKKIKELIKNIIEILISFKKQLHKIYNRNQSICNIKQELYSPFPIEQVITCKLDTNDYKKILNTTEELQIKKTAEAFLKEVNELKEYIKKLQLTQCVKEHYLKIINYISEKMQSVSECKKNNHPYTLEENEQNIFFISTYIKNKDDQCPALVVHIEKDAYLNMSNRCHTSNTNVLCSLNAKHKNQYNPNKQELKCEDNKCIVIKAQDLENLIDELEKLKKYINDSSNEYN